MSLPIDIATLTIIHTIICLIALFLGIPALMLMFGKNLSKCWMKAFLIMAFASTATGFLFPIVGITPALGTGIVVTAVFLMMAIANYLFHRAGKWRAVYGAGIVMNVYFLAFVTIAQAFLKVPALQALAPTGSEPPFAVAQLVLLVFFGWLGTKAVKAYKV